MQAVILAAGRGTRLKPITKSRSKAMLPVLDKPIIARIMDRLIFNHITDFLIVVNPSDPLIKRYFQENLLPGINIRLIEQAQPLGMADALKHVEPWINDDFLLSACDSLLPTSEYANLLLEWENPPKPSALLTLMEVSPEQVCHTAIVKIEGNLIRRIIEKPSPQSVLSNIASLPVYILNRQIFSLLPRLKPSSRGEIELQDAIQALIDIPTIVRGQKVAERLNLTSAQDLLEINLHFLTVEKSQYIAESVQVGKDVKFIPPYWIGPQVKIEDHCTLGPKVFIESDCHLEKRCHLSNSIMLKGARLVTGQTRNLDIIF